MSEPIVWRLEPRPRASGARVTAELAPLAEAVVRQRGRRSAERSLRVAVGRVWRRQMKALPLQAIAQGAVERAPQPIVEVANPQPGDPLVDLIVAHWADEEAALARIIGIHGARAATSAMNLTLAQIGYPRADSLLPVVRDLIAGNALSHAASIEQTSVMRLRGILTRGIEDGLDARSIARRLREEMQGWTRKRAETVARTEVATAWEGAQYEVLAANGWSGRVWLTAEDERVDAGGFSGPCVDNAAAGVVAIGTAFPSGHMFPPAHPNCRCSTAPAT